jgi:hypothetical protein
MYSRDELLKLSDISSSRDPHSALAAAYDDCPQIKRRADTTSGGGGGGNITKLPFNWSEAFNENVAATAVFNYAEHNGISGAAALVNNMNNNTAKKNFLDVLRPNAPRRVWDETLGEWVEADTRG